MITKKIKDGVPGGRSKDYCGATGTKGLSVEAIILTVSSHLKWDGRKSWFHHIAWYNPMGKVVLRNDEKGGGKIIIDWHRAWKEEREIAPD